MKKTLSINSYIFFKQICQIKTIDEIWLFGSRARGDNSPRSDIDLYIIAPKATNEDILNVSSIVEEADTLLAIDIVWSHTVNSNELKEQIKNQHIILYKKKDDNRSIKI